MIPLTAFSEYLLASSMSNVFIKHCSFVDIEATYPVSPLYLFVHFNTTMIFLLSLNNGAILLLSGRNVNYILVYNLLSCYYPGKNGREMIYLNQILSLLMFYIIIRVDNNTETKQGE